MRFNLIRRSGIIILYRMDSHNFFQYFYDRRRAVRPYPIEKTEFVFGVKCEMQKCFCIVTSEVSMNLYFIDDSGNQN